MDEIEVPLEQVQEHIHEAAHNSQQLWMGQVALFSALVAVFAAVSALLAGHHSNEAMITQLKASDSWGYYQAKGIKSSILVSKNQLLKELGKEVPPKDEEKVEDYKKEQDEISERAKEFEAESSQHLKTHVTLARSVTLFQVAIAIAAISVLTRRRRFFMVSIGFAVVGVAFFIWALIH